MVTKVHKIFHTCKQHHSWSVCHTCDGR